MAKPIKVQKLQTWMGATYRVYVHGVYWGAASTRANALQAGKKALETWDFKTMKRKKARRLQIIYPPQA
jgi:hypothetical protein